jgi:glutamate/tyrosine decarboxylase-like PLP-dependent enzyme
MSLAEGKMPTGSPVAPLPGAAPPLASSTTPVPGTTSSSAFLFGLDSVARAYASSVSTSMSGYEELPRHHLRSTLDLVAFMPASEYLDSTETPDTELRATAFRHHDPRDIQPHMHPLYYYFGAPDSDSTDDTYDPT